MTSAFDSFRPLQEYQARFLSARRARVVALFPAYDELRGQLLGLGGLEVDLDTPPAKR